MCETFSFREISGFVFFFSGLKLTALHVPGSVQSGESVKLQCEYDLDSETLYSVKWYKNNIEFFRYLPSDSMPGQVYDLPGMFVDVSIPRAIRVLNITVQTSSRHGQFRHLWDTESLTRIDQIPLKRDVLRKTSASFRDFDIVTFLNRSYQVT